MRRVNSPPSSLLYNFGYSLGRQVFILVLTLPVYRVITGRSLSDGYQSIGVGSASRISRISAEPPRSLIARRGRIIERDAKAYTRLTAGRSGFARRGQS